MQQNTDRVIQIGNTTENAKRENPQRGRVYDTDGIAPSLLTCGGGNLEPQIIEPQMLTMQRTEEAKRLRRVNGDVGVPFRGSKEYTIKSDGVSNTLTTFTEKECLVAEPQAVGHYRPEGRTGNIPYRDYELRPKSDGIANTITAQPGDKDALIAEPTIQFVGNIYPSKAQSGKVVSPDGIAPTVCDSHGEVTRITERTCAYKEMSDGSIRGYNPNTPDKRGISEEQYASPDAIAPTVTTAHEPKIVEPMVSAHPLGHAHENPKPQVDVAPTLRATDYKCPPVVYEPVQYYYRIRKLTPKECFRLMDVDDPDIDKLITAKGPKGKPALSKSACYKLAGNSIVVACLYHIFKSMFVTPCVANATQLTLDIIAQ